MARRLVHMVRARDPWPRSQGEGGFSTIEAVVVIPAAVIMTMLVIQYVMLWHARNVAEAAAQNALRNARGYQATVVQGRASGSEYLKQVAGKMLRDPQVIVDRDAASVSVTVNATVISVVPFGHYTVSETATGPVEHFAKAG